MSMLFSDNPIVYHLIADRCAPPWRSVALFSPIRIFMLSMTPVHTGLTCPANV